MAENAGGIHMKYFRKSGLEQSTKLNDSDVVTIADKEAEEWLYSSAFPYARHHLRGIRH